jgi:hypothetical protein
VTDARPQSTIQGMSVACPPGWADASMLAISAHRPGPSGVSPGLVVTREALPDGLEAEPIALELYAEQQLRLMQAELADFALVGRTSSHPGAERAELLIDWTAEGVPVRQWISYLPLQDRKVLICTATAGRSDFGQAEPTFRAILATLRVV